MRVSEAKDFLVRQTAEQSLLEGLPLCDLEKRMMYFPVVLHRKVGSRPCELVQLGSLMTATGFAWVEIEGEKSEIYSLELGPGDYLSIALHVSGHVAKDARKSGFDVREESTNTADLPQVRSVNANAECPSLQSAIGEVEQTQGLKRAELQSRIYRPGTDDIMPPSPLKEDSASTADQFKKTNNSFTGSVFLSVLIGIDGTVQQVKIVKSANPEIDKIAEERVAQWKFAPARKKGLPVPSIMPVEVTFIRQ